MTAALLRDLEMTPETSEDYWPTTPISFSYLHRPSVVLDPFLQHNSVGVYSKTRTIQCTVEKIVIR